MGLPARFNIGLQNQVEHFAGETRDRSFTLEGRYALANWNLYLQTGSAGPLARMLKVSDYLIETSTPSEGGMYLRSEEPGDTRTASTRLVGPDSSCQSR